MSDQEAIGSFIDKWRARWPEWSVAEVFVRRELREPALAWMALVQELTDAAWGGGDPRPGEAKLGWWLEELQGWARGARRHPLGAVLQKFPVAWTQRAAALPSLRDSRERPVDIDDARAQVRVFAGALAAIEEGMFGGSRSEAHAVIATNLLHLRLAHHPGDAAPLQVLAQAGEDGMIAAWSHQLAGHSVGGATRPRRVLAGLAQARLRRGDAVQPLPAASALWVAWRAARA
jgi:hypothetical protein